ncbi:MAG: hypothetical protein AAFW89_07980 [Bacteroidota bacterium]
MKLKRFLFAILLSLTAYSVYGQTKVTFNVDLRPLIKQNKFNLATDQIQISGSFRPLSTSSWTRMLDRAPRDSVYSVTLNFPRRLNGQELLFNYRLYTEEDGIMREDLPRYLKLTGSELKLDALYFNHYVN